MEQIGADAQDADLHRSVVEAVFAEQSVVESDAAPVAQRRELRIANDAVKASFEEGTAKRSVRNWASLLLGLVAFATFGWLFVDYNSGPIDLGNNPAHVDSSPASLPAANDSRYEGAAVPIRQIQVGMRVPAFNPLRSDQDRNADSLSSDVSDLRKIVVDLPKGSGDGRVLVTLLRSSQWLDERTDENPNHVWLDLAEMGAAGYGKVLSNEPAPAVADGPGQLVTATFVHNSAQVLDMVFEPTGSKSSDARLSEVADYQASSTNALSIGVTSMHPFWSESRREFVPAGDIRYGEEVVTIQGQLWRLTSVTARAGPEPVYNFEVAAEHVYYVTNQGLLVHNMYPDPPDGVNPNNKPGIEGGSEAAQNVAPGGALTGGAARAAKFGHLWQKASLQKAITRHAGENYTTWLTKTGKRIYENPATGRQIVHDLEGGYFRIFQPNKIGGTKGKYLDMLGKVPSPAQRVKSGAIKNLPLFGDDLQQWTHFLIE